MKCEIIKGWCEPCSVEAICCKEMLCDICTDREGKGKK